MGRVFTHVLAEEERLDFFLLWYPGIKVMLRLPFLKGGNNLNAGPQELNKLLASLLMSDHQ